MRPLELGNVSYSPQNSKAIRKKNNQDYSAIHIKHCKLKLIMKRVYEI